MYIARSLAALACVSALSAQRIIVVQSPPTSALRTALAQARHGDVLVVRAGFYDGGLRTSQGIAILCDANVTILTDRSGAALTVDQVPAGRTFRMRGGLLMGFMTGLAPQLVIRGSQGATFFENVTVGAGVVVTDSRNAQFNSCGLPNVQVERASAGFSNCRFHANPCTGTPDPIQCAALGLRQSTVEVAGGTLTGAETQNFFVRGTPGIYSDAGNLTIAGGTPTIVAGGVGFPAIQTVSGRLRLDTTVQLRTVNAPPIAGNAVVTRTRVPSVLSRGASAGQLFSARVFAEVGSSTHILASLARDPVATPFGSLWVDSTALVLDSGIVPASGERGVTFRLPPIARGTPVVLQSLSTLTNGQLVLGPPTAVVLN